jgi:hypothetical protein
MLKEIASLLLLTLFAIGVFPVAVMAEDKVFTNQDIEKYKKPSDSEPQSTKIDRTIDKTSERREKAEKIKEEREREYWCKKATQYRRNIDKIKEEIAETEKALSGESGEKLFHKKKKGLKKKLQRDNKRLKYARQDLAEIEDEAHRNKIPPGWLRCQFE